MDKQVVKEVFSTAEACEYLDMDLPTFRYHVYIKKHLIPDRKIGRSLIFSRATLEAFKKKYRADGYTMPEVAEHLGVELSLIRHHVFNTKLLVANRKNGKQHIFDRETVEAFSQAILGRRQQKAQEPEPA